MQSRKRIFSLLIALLALFSLFLTQSVSMAQSTTTPAQVELVGVIQTMDLDTITVNQQVVNVASAEIKIPLEVGAAVKVEGTISASGQIIAREVKAPNDVQGGILPGEIEIVGLLSASDATTMTIGGQIFDVSHAEVKAGVEVGKIVKVHATPSATGPWVAREVELSLQVSPDNTNTNDNNANDNSANANDNQNTNDNTVNFDQGEFELTGTLTAMDTGSITVEGQTINIANAEVKGALVVGALVKVHLSNENGQLVAREVELVGQSNSGSNDNTAIVIPANCVPAQPAGWTTYTIQAGDTLSRIADRSHGSLSDIALANCITDPRVIVAGTTIFVPQRLASDDNQNANSNHNQNDNSQNGNDNQGADDHGGNNQNDNQGGNHGGDNQNNNNNDNHGGEGSGHG